MKDLTKIIQQAAQNSNQSAEQIEQELIKYLVMKYSDDADKIQSRKLDELVERAKFRILGTLYNSTECRVSEGWNHLAVVPSYRNLLWFIIGQDPVYQGALFYRVVDELLADELIYTRTFPGDKEPKEVGLTEKGKMFWATKDL